MATRPGFSIDVHINGARVGRFYRVDRQRLGFEYDEDYRAADFNYPISLSMPKVSRTYRDRTGAMVVSNYL